MGSLVSVILPVYNGEKYIRDAIESILEQTYQNIELIIIDDGSSDNTIDLLMEYKNKDKRVVIISRENRGLVTSLNEGILISHGKYVARMDADDISHTERIEKQVKYLEENEDVYLLGTNYSLIYEEGLSEEVKKAAEGTHRRSRAVIDKENWFLSTNETMKFIHPTIMMRRSLFDKIGLYMEYKLEDIELYFRTGINNLRIDKLEENLLDYRVREVSKSRTDLRAEQTKEIMQVKMKYLIDNIFDKSREMKYLIWGADISGDIALEVISKALPQAKCLAYIDSFKEGVLNGYKVIKPEHINEFDTDYIFVCTNGGAVAAREHLIGINKIEIKEFFKIS
jgi:glycosyltransferase involved in cell wall biosynthesis